MRLTDAGVLDLYRRMLASNSWGAISALLVTEANMEEIKRTIGARQRAEIQSENYKKKVKRHLPFAESSIQSENP